MAGQVSIYGNVERFRVVANGQEVEDVTSISLPTLEHPTTSVSTSGMAGELSIPDAAFINSMTLSITHNKGRNSEQLQASRASIIVSLARQKYDSAGQQMGFVNITYKCIGLHVKTDEGKAETKNPLSVTDDFSLTRYEEKVEGQERVLIDIPAGIIRINGQEFTSDVEKALSE